MKVISRSKSLKKKLAMLGILNDDEKGMYLDDVAPIVGKKMLKEEAPQ